MKKLIVVLFIAVSPLIGRGDTVSIVTFPDTLFDKSLPSVEIRPKTYHNADRVTTAGYELIVRGTALAIHGALLYNGEHDEPLHTLSPFNLQVGDSTNRNRIDILQVENKFPFTTYFSGDDSLVVLTDKGNITLYWNDERRAAAHYDPILAEKSRELRRVQYAAAAIILIALVALITALILQRARRLKQNQDVSDMLSFISDSEMRNRELQIAVDDLLKKNFDTINRLCYEYFEKADTPILKKSIYNEVESEILKLKDPAQIGTLEDVLNHYCNNVMDRIKAQLPDLSEKELTLLIYLYSGLSARAICILTDIQIKNFYMRRQRLKTKILNSSAPDREEFAGMM